MEHRSPEVVAAPAGSAGAPLADDLPDSSPRARDAPGGDAVALGGSPTPEPARSRYSMGSLPNMLRSMFVIGLLVLALVAVIPRIGQVDRPAIDAAAKASQTASETKWPIELPKGLGEGWKPTVATYAPGTGKVPTFTTVWTTPGGSDIALKQAEAVTDEWLVRSVDGGTLSGVTSVAGRGFERFDDPSRRQVSYVVRGKGAKGLTLVATTTGDERELKTFLASLQKVAPGP